MTGTEGLISPSPDAYIAVEESSSKTQRYFLEVFTTAPQRVLAKRIDAYAEYYASEEWQNSTDKPFPEITIICPNERMKRYLTSAIQRNKDEPDLRFRLLIKRRRKGYAQGTSKRCFTNSHHM